MAATRGSSLVRGEDPHRPRPLEGHAWTRSRGAATVFVEIQLERQDFNGQVLTIRADDMRVIGGTFGLGVDEMVERLRILGLLSSG